MAGAAAGALAADRARIQAAHAAGSSGLTTAHALSDAVDAAVQSLWRSSGGSAGGPSGAALVAVGGYGRREMSPHSDIDLIVLHGRRDDVSGPAKALAYELWDAGLDVAPSLHTIGESLRLASDRLDTLTAFFDARLLAGNKALFGEWSQKLRASARRAEGRLVDQLTSGTVERRARAGDAGAELEPNLKAGRGGLRDLATLGWLEQVAPERISPNWRGDLAPALDFVLRVRHQLHFMTDRRTDVLAMRDQAAVAEALGVTDPVLVPEIALMRILYGHCRRVAYELDRALLGVQEVDLGPAPPPGQPLLSGPPPGPPPGPPASQPWPAEPWPAEPWPPELRQRFLSVLAGPEPRAAFEALDADGRWLALLPEWAGIRCLPQRNIYHRFAVDVHCVETVSVLGEVEASAQDVIARSVPAPGPDRELLALACLFHDIGKGAGEDHSMRGERLTRAAGERMGLPAEDLDDLAWLVGSHLLLAEAATRRDIRDERVILTVAEAVGTPRRLRLLVALTAADSMATGPSAWGSWKATLVSRLADRVLHVVQRGELVGRDASALAARRRKALIDALAEFPAAEVAEHLANMPREWLLAEPLDEQVRQSKAMLARPRAGEVALSADLEEESGIWQALAVTKDRPGLFFKVSGALALHGFNVLGAELYTREDGLALEVFRLEALGDEEHRLDRVREDLRKVLAGRLSLDMRLAQKRQDYRSQTGKGNQAPPRVVIDNEASDFYTLIEVHAEDRIGLLYAITKALADLLLDIHKAKVSTYGHDVVDVFYVRDLEGGRIVDPEHVAEVEASLLYAVGAAR
ncbi:MAG: ACT domain-containing protein [Actinomycetota bacterium]